VRILERDDDAMARGLDRIRSSYASSVRRGSLENDAMETRLSCIEPVKEYEALSAVDFAVEAVFEDMAVKKEVFTRLDAVLPEGAVLASNTSALSIDDLARMTQRPQDVVGTHFFSPANIMKLLEIVRGMQTAPDVIVTAMDLGRRIGKTAAVCGNCYGFVANRSRYPFGVESGYLLMEGASVEQVDRVMIEFGYPIGPMAVNDIAGVDVGYMVRQAKKQVDPDSYETNPVADRLYEMGRYGQKTGAGFYRYEPGERKPLRDAAVDQVIEEVARENGVHRRTVDDSEILNRLLFSSVNEAARILEEGNAYRPSDVDVMWLAGFNFPRYRGGLMYWADQLGLDTVHRQVSEWHRRYGRRWTPAPLLEQLARDGSSFAEWQETR
jgi:3-hydroxyacyl-CoA dehydrogenase